MVISVYFLIFLSLLLGAVFALGFIWAAKTNQFKDIEEPKYRMLREED
ncbi:MAG TPA: cbb3-type cytochrome oxidase assembly protein CcoS [Bacteroidota bacterium]|nr:cbb3-type cytochrome oxidase assembly protein CcoS [Bacteroidota bacterium]